MLLIIGASFWSVIRNRIGGKNGCCAPHSYGLPLPWIAVSRLVCCRIRPSAVGDGEVLPTAVANSSLTRGRPDLLNVA
ncbi:hypothetical protein LN650_22750 [Klebsiella pneumoniae subsp. pneumoniae]|nr:hypothetical protein [Klebsiella pneumoniae subsp. pneumoniae]